MTPQRIVGARLEKMLDQAAELSARAKQASSRARREGDIDSHRTAIEAHRRANIAWTTAHRLSIDADTPKATQRMTYDRYVRHYEAVCRHWTRCWDLGTRRGLSFPHGAPCGPTKAYLVTSEPHTAKQR